MACMMPLVMAGDVAVVVVVELIGVVAHVSVVFDVCADIAR